jgi:hypothetical protein
MGFFMGVVKGTGPVAAGATEARSS